MSMTDPISDMLTRVRNGQMVRLARISCPSSRAVKGVLEVLKREGYIQDYTETEVRKGVKELTIELKYYKGQPVIKKLNRISKPGLRQYTQVDKMPKVYSGLGISILSTSKGVLADHEAITAGVGGELLCNVF